MPLDGSTLKARRTELDMTQAEAAKRAGMASGMTWSDYENGRRVNCTVETLENMARVLECEPGDLLTPASKKTKK